MGRVRRRAMRKGESGEGGQTGRRRQGGMDGNGECGDWEWDDRGGGNGVLEMGRGAIGVGRGWQCGGGQR